MKVLLDAHISPAVARLLVEMGHDAVAVFTRTDIPDHASDADLLAIARAEDRAIVTNDVKDFRPLAAQRLAAGEGHAGLVLVASSFPRTRAATSRLAGAIAEIIEANPEGLANSERWIS